MKIRNEASVKNARKMIARRLGLDNMVDEWERTCESWEEIIFQVLIQVDNLI